MDRPAAARADGHEADLARAASLRLRGDVSLLRADARLAVDETLRRVASVRARLGALHGADPVERVTWRVRSPESIVATAVHRGLELSPAALRRGVTDVAGVRLVCTSRRAVRPVLGALLTEPGTGLLAVEDHLAHPPVSGCRTLHAVLAVPVRLPGGPGTRTVEVQVLTVVMDAWDALRRPLGDDLAHAGLPEDVRARMRSAADRADRLDRQLDRVRAEVAAWRAARSEHPAGARTTPPAGDAAAASGGW
ncbi:GTP pyrophosphokinase family protein [Cellulomonas sp. C5510]|uniref:GTP pyrophosphokinase n=1 Tax=Cellulomonas sp. C5510 TaxID=2871170 RepID=UPI001C939EB7|nr:hypothetical protein [Cellulomonas sp. C5510]QZN86988.1 hypothetical protein K5O09_07730 [Cellulomonas sp. C5510]